MNRRQFTRAAMFTVGALAPLASSATVLQDTPANHPAPARPSFDPKGDFANDVSEMRPGVHERKWEIDSLCYPIRLAYKYWSTTGDAEPLDSAWHDAARRIVSTFREQQRLAGNGPYRFARMTTSF